MTLTKKTTMKKEKCKTKLHASCKSGARLGLTRQRWRTYAMLAIHLGHRRAGLSAISLAFLFQLAVALRRLAKLLRFKFQPQADQYAVWGILG